MKNNLKAHFLWVCVLPARCSDHQGHSTAAHVMFALRCMTIIVLGWEPVSANATCVRLQSSYFTRSFTASSVSLLSLCSWPWKDLNSSWKLWREWKWRATLLSKRTITRKSCGCLSLRLWFFQSRFAVAVSCSRFQRSNMIWQCKELQLTSNFVTNGTQTDRRNSKSKSIIVRNSDISILDHYLNPE